MFVPGSKHMKRLEMLGRKLEPKTIRTKRSMLSLIIEQFGDLDIYLLFLCSVLCGLRMGEAIALRKSQFLFDQGMLVVDGFYKYEARVRTNFNKCGSAENQKFRVVPMPDELAVVMKKYIEGQNLADGDYVFTRYGVPLRKHLLEKWFQRAVELAGIETEGRKLTPHSLRFTYIIRMRRNVDGETVQKLAVAAANKLFA